MENINNIGMIWSLWIGMMQDWSNDQRGRLLDGNRRIDNTGNKLEATQALAIETEEIGRNTLETLAGQRGQLVDASHGVCDFIRDLVNG